jgi:hypothetical protein
LLSFSTVSKASFSSHPVGRLGAALPSAGVGEAPSSPVCRCPTG